MGFSFTDNRRLSGERSAFLITAIFTLFFIFFDSRVKILKKIKIKVYDKFKKT